MCASRIINMSTVKFSSGIFVWEVIAFTAQILSLILWVITVIGIGTTEYIVCLIRAPVVGPPYAGPGRHMLVIRHGVEELPSW